MRAFLNRLIVDLEKRAGQLGHPSYPAGPAPAPVSQEEILYRLQRAANTARAEKDLNRAEALYVDILMESGNFVPAWLGLGMTLLDQERYEQARTAFDTVRQLQPDAVDAHYMLGVTELKINHAAAAIQNWKDALQIQRDFLPALRQLVPLLVQTDAPAAEALCRDAISLAPRVADFHLLLGLTLAEMQRPLDAIEELKICSEQDPSILEARLNLARLYNQLGDGPRAMDEARALLERAPAMAEAQVEMDRALALSKANGSG